MAYENSAEGIPGLVAGADLRTSQFLACVINSSGKPIVNTTAGVQIDGILQNKPNTDQAATVKPKGVSKMKAGGTVTAGDLLASDTAGKAVTATTGQEVIGRALSSGAANEIITVLLDTNGEAP